MSKVSFTFDSESKTVTVSVDGKDLDNVMGVSYYYYPENCGCDPQGYVSISTHLKDENGVSACRTMSWGWEMDEEGAAKFIEKSETASSLLVKQALKR